MACTSVRGRDATADGTTSEVEYECEPEEPGSNDECRVCTSNADDESDDADRGGRGSAVRLACFLRILRVASEFAFWNYTLQ